MTSPAHQQTVPESRLRYPAIRRAARVALLTSFLLLIVKFIAYYLTDSKAILSDALESIINVGTGAFLVMTVAISSQPADQDHPYGHGKIEAFAAGLEGGLIIFAAIMIMVEAVPAFFNPKPLTNLGPGLSLVLAAGLINLGVGLYLLHSGKKLKSDALRADGHHLLTDFYTSAGVIVALLLVRFTGIVWLDPLIACLVAVNIFLPGINLVRGAGRNLMNKADPELLDRIVACLNEIKQPGWLYPHKLRAIRSGRYHHVDLHISMPHYWTLDKIHATEQEITERLLEAMGEEGDVMIHVDPCEPEYCPDCRVTSCGDRKGEQRKSGAWTVKEVIAPRGLNDKPEPRE
ncbi:MAG: cation diffusion facilitator family transporter [Desulfobacterales bacterium]|nr:cation diffusion facilitator family transporter [Desulfobacterales bacterium]